MWIILLAWKNIWRNRSRTLITVAALFFAVILATLAESLKQGIFDNLVKNVVSFYTGYLQVHKQGYQDEQILDNSFLRSKKVEDVLYNNKKITAASPRLESFALASSASITKGCQVVGIQPATESALTGLKEKMVAGEYIQDSDQSVLLSAGLADHLQLRVGDTIVLIGQGYHGAMAAGQYPVKGILHFGSPQLNDRVLFMPLGLAQYLFSAEERVTSLVVSIKNDKQLDAIAAEIRESLGKDYEVMTWEQLLPDIRQHISADSNNMKFVQGFLYLLVAFGIFSTLIMMMLERKYEMGMLVAIGMKKIKLVWLFLAESVITVLMGCLAGILASIPLVHYFKRYPIRMGGETAEAYQRFGFEPIFPTSTESSIFLYQALIVLIMGLILSLYPISKAIRLDPVTAMKR